MKLDTDCIFRPELLNLYANSHMAAEESRRWKRKGRCYETWHIKGNFLRTTFFPNQKTPTSIIFDRQKSVVHDWFQCPLQLKTKTNPPAPSWVWRKAKSPTNDQLSRRAAMSHWRWQPSSTATEDCSSLGSRSEPHLLTARRWSDERRSAFTPASYTFWHTPLNKKLTSLLYLTYLQNSTN